MLEPIYKPTSGAEPGRPVVFGGMEDDDTAAEAERLLRHPARVKRQGRRRHCKSCGRKIRRFIEEQMDRGEW